MEPIAVIEYTSVLAPYKIICLLRLCYYDVFLRSADIRYLFIDEEIK